MTAAKRYYLNVNYLENKTKAVNNDRQTFGLYSALRACRAIVFKSNRQSKLTVATIFLYNIISNTLKLI